MASPETVLTAGASGFVGRHLCRALAKESGVRAADRVALEFDDVEVHRGDLAEPGFCDDVCAGVDAVVHLAAMASVPGSIADPLGCHRDTATTTLNLLMAARRHGVRRFVFISTAAIYGDGPSRRQVETETPRMLSPYAAAKLGGEAYVEAFARQGVDGVSLRFFNVYGPGQSGSGYAGVIPAFASALREGRPMVIYGDGRQTRDFIHVSDVVSATLAALNCTDELGGQRINVGTGRAVTIRQLGEMMAQIAGKEAVFEPRDPRPGDVRHSCADVSRAREVLGFEARVKLEDGLMEMMHG